MTGRNAAFKAVWFAFGSSIQRTTSRVICNLGYTRFDKMAETLGCYGEYVERPDEIRPALDRAQREVDRGSVALVNVKTDDRARAGTVAFAQYAT